MCEPQPIKTQWSSTDILAGKADNLTAKYDPTLENVGAWISGRLNITHSFFYG
jgi:hypothetical protein